MARPKIETTTLIFKNENGRYLRRVDQIDMSASEVLSLLMKPILRAAGYQEETIDELFETTNLTINLDPSFDPFESSDTGD